MLNNEALNIIKNTMGSVKGWECVTPTRKIPLNKYRLQVAIDQLWKERDDLIDQGEDAGNPDYEMIDEMAEAARILEGLL